ncbi:HAD-IC family P-type ATPase [candidate division WWE3 bacterium]|nr:HAD-IC family P-type ATPase [candidate division WWE3 bacterium]
MIPRVINSVTSIFSDEFGGLTMADASRLLARFGPNRLPEVPPPTDLKIFLSQFKSPLVYILLISCFITLGLGEYGNAFIIAIAVFLNTVLGFVQERKAGKALEALKKLVLPTASVVRNGKLITLSVDQLVPGDLVFLKQGDKIPADGKLVDANRFFVTEAILTGESDAIQKHINSEVYMGTIVTGGKAKLHVTVTGASTEMGKIALSIANAESETPLGKQLVYFSKQLSVVVLILTVLVFTFGLFGGLPLLTIFTTSVALAVSAIPEGLLVGLTAVLAIGMQRILGRKGLVRNLTSAETLGGVTTICIDKTGTLTQGKMQVANVFGEEQSIALQSILANDLDTSVVIASWEWANEKVHKTEIEKVKKFGSIDSIPFSSEHKYFASLNRWFNDSHMVFITGAPELLLKHTVLTAAEKERIHHEILLLTSEGKRILGFAKKLVPNTLAKLSKDTVLNDVEWVGMLSFTDPVRTDVKEALENAKIAGIRIMVITGDHANTAATVMKQLGIKVANEDIVLGSELGKMSEKELERRLFDGERHIVKLFARTRPEQKLKIIETLKIHGEIVAMMGDGVNDAPALAKADIGIVVSDASDVAKESADLVLMDSSFSTIISAVEEGRNIFDNIRKIILYLMADAFEEILVILTAIFLKIPLPLNVVQILWINLVSDGLPHLALTMEPKTAGSMQKEPRLPSEPLVSKWMIRIILVISTFGWLFSMGMYFFILYKTSDLLLARSILFATVGLDSLVYLFSVRTLREPFWKSNPFNNLWLLGAVAAAACLQIVPFTNPFLMNVFNIKPLGDYWLFPIIISFMIFIAVEIFKLIDRKRLN